MSDKRLQSFDSGSHYDFTGNLDKSPVQRSLFNLGHGLSMSFPAKSFGKLLPVLCMETLPTDDIQVALNVLLRCLPVEIPLYSKQRVTFHAFYADASSLWQNAEVYYRKGNTGNTVLRKPTLNLQNCSGLDTSDVVGYESLLHYLYGIPGYVKLSDLNGKINALPLFMYWKIWQSYYMNRNLYMNDKIRLPDDFSRLRLGDDGILLSAKDVTGTNGFNLNEWQWRDFPDDRFTGSFPFPQRGDAPTLSYDISGYAPITTDPTGAGDFGVWRFSAQTTNSPQSASIGFIPAGGGNINSQTTATFLQDGVHTDFTENRDTGRRLMVADLGDASVKLDIGLNDIRRLACAQTELERMARTDGSYAEFGITFFGAVPRNTRSYDVSFIGGAYKDIFYTEVIQTSASTPGGSPLGNYAGHGIMSLESNQGFLGQVRTTDYGYLMVLMSVMPDVIYSQGLDRAWTRLTQAQEYLPDRAKLGMQPILNHELAFFGDNDDYDLFAYDDAFNEFRFKSNRLLGKLSDPNAESFWHYTQSRYFPPNGQHPTYSQSFATTKENVRDQYLVAPTECPFHMDLQFNIRAVRPLPYKSKPASIV